MVEDGYVVGEQEDVRAQGGFLDVWEGGWTGFAALGLEDFDQGEGLEVNEAGGCVLVGWVVGE